MVTDKGDPPTDISTNSCSCEEDIESLKCTILDLQCRSMKNNLIFTDLHEVKNEHIEDLLERFSLYGTGNRLQN